MTDPFTLLGLTPEADDDAVRKAYLQQVRLYSPERHPERFQELHAAYEQLREWRGRVACRLFSLPDPDPGRLLAPLLQADATAPRPAVKPLQELLGESVRGFQLTATSRGKG
ncbi:MAG: J domain-containing protein [Magnetococcales bacterium]|nr:J domain-containing protein [Magnetococcales bacterium]